MHIERVHIDDGFLDGFDVEFSSGFNVVIGARGTGKTSLIELIKYCLDVRGHNFQEKKSPYDHAISVLGSGEVIVTLIDKGQRVTVMRSAQDPLPRANGSFRKPLVFSQTEIESIGLHAKGRLQLLDEFVLHKPKEAEFAHVVSEIRAVSLHISRLRKDIEELEIKVAHIPGLDAELLKIWPQEMQMSQLSAVAGKKTKELEIITSEIAQISVSNQVLQRTLLSARSWSTMLSSSIHAASPDEDWPEQGGDNPLPSVHRMFAHARENIHSALLHVSNAVNEINIMLESSQRKAADLELKAKDVRKELEAIQVGSSYIAKESQRLKQARAQLEAEKSALAQRLNQLTMLTDRREALLDAFDELKNDRHQGRLKAARELSDSLAPTIKIQIKRSGQFAEFSAAISEALKGSGLRVGELASALARKISPRELLEAVEANDYEFIENVANISRDRAVRLISHLHSCELGAIASVETDDAVDFLLLDGTNYKDITELSTGQRCTVVLPIILKHQDAALILDQPEDHIDNAFITGTLIKAIDARDSKTQILVTSHNANIPVLGDADLVVQLGSNGKRGFALTVGELSNPNTVSAITNVMEGGREAFRRRAGFYNSHTSP